MTVNPIETSPERTHNPTIPNLQLAAEIIASFKSVIESAKPFVEASRNPKLFNLSETERIQMEQTATRLIGSLTAGHALLGAVLGINDNPGDLLEFTTSAVGTPQPHPIKVIYYQPEATPSKEDAFDRKEDHLESNKLEKFQKLIRTKIIPGSMINGDNVNPNGTELVIVDDNKIRIGSQTLTIVDPDTLSLFNGLLIFRDQPFPANTIRALGFEDRVTIGATNQAVNIALRKLIDKLNVPTGGRIVSVIGERNTRRYQIDPGLYIRDARQHEEELDFDPTKIIGSILQNLKKK